MTDWEDGIWGIRLFYIRNENVADGNELRLTSTGLGNYIYLPDIEYYRIHPCVIGTLTQLANFPTVKIYIGTEKTGYSEISSEIQVVNPTIEEKHIMERCSCGFYAMFTDNGAILRAFPDINYCMALVQGFGDVVIHERGWRAEVMRIHSIIAHPFYEWWPGQSGPLNFWRKISTLYNRPIIDINDAGRVMSTQREIISNE